MLQAMMDAFSLPDLRGKILFTLGMLVIFRFVAHVPVPIADLEAMRHIWEKMSDMPLLGMLDLFSGGALRNISVAAMGVYPYITASIIMQLLVPVIPRLQALSQEGEAGRHKINQITHWLTVPLAMIQGYGQLVLLSREGLLTSPVGLSGAALFPTAVTVISMAAGTMFLVWLGERITERGIGNGVSIIIFGGIVAGLPDMVYRGMISGQQVQMWGILAFGLLAIALIGVIVIFTEAHRRIPVQYARSVIRGGRMYRQSGSTHIPLRVNTAGMIPLIFAMSVLIAPATIASYFSGAGGFWGDLAGNISGWLSTTGGLYWGLFFLLTLGFAFFYTMVIFQQMNLAQTLQRQGGFVPGIRPGKPTAEYLDKVIKRITWGGALFLASVAIMPFVAQQATGVVALQLPAIGMLIVVGVVLDTMKQLEAQLVVRQYEGFIR
ncbi:MAG TPA: preprotein translocase subunit SecY [Dehalococcoidia bacterium]|nr:preprotein translocase subunit SecY [Dehalococcoidia bacterium]